MYAELAAEAERDSAAATVVNGLWHGAIPWLDELPLDQRLAYVDSPIPCFRRHLVVMDDLPPAVVERFYAEPDARTAHLVARRPDTPGHVLERHVVEHGVDPGHGKTSLLDHPNFPKDAFVRFATSSFSRQREWAPHDVDLPAELVVRLVRDGDPRPAASAWRNPAVPVDAMYRLLDQIGS